MLIESGGDMLARDDQGMKPSVMLIACADKNAELAPAGPVQNAPWSLQYAAGRKQANVVSMLLTMGANPNALGPEGTRALEVASLRGDAAIVRILLDHGANPNLRSKAGSTPLHDAALNGNKEVIELLLTHGAEPNALDADSQSTPLHFAASFGRLEAVKVLVEHGANVDAKNAKGQTALQLAISGEQKDVAAFLRESHGTN
jgi:ankyrin repeat protein